MENSIEDHVKPERNVAFGPVITRLMEEHMKPGATIDDLYVVKTALEILLPDQLPEEQDKYQKLLEESVGEHMKPNRPVEGLYELRDYLKEHLKPLRQWRGFL